MSDFLKHFVQAPDGSWTCLQACRHTFGMRTLQIPAGLRFRRGQLLDGVDVASFLDHRFAFATGD
jgi:hypothetical protein